MEEQTLASQNGSRIDLSQLRAGAEVQGRVVKIGKIGAILNVGGFPALLHISELTGPKSRRSTPLREGDEATVWVSEVDAEKKRLLVTFNKPPERPMASIQPGIIVHGKIVRLTKFGAFVDIGAEKDGLIHISELAHTRIGDPSEVVSVAEEVDVKVLSVDLEKGQVSLSLKATTPEPRQQVAAPQEAVPVMTPMQAAWQEAFDEAGRRSRPPRKQRRERERGMPRGEERDDLFLRTIRYKS